jgi:hypothetical protein
LTCSRLDWHECLQCDTGFGFFLKEKFEK